ncbi:NusG domain II-containing protein [Citroniella saccharovorans]|uniref:NusG domain II-containing protein n=1 Tax=Citroniella saccharovorans TaxID=2053367 RepID=A0AAW9MZ65_9FIRM|nr:NusG domain II-containing protein [Citroniella saccharovorans]MEB3429885.1 NusG domain II-containing protein [Citroniella saccharovorans]
MYKLNKADMIVFLFIFFISIVGIIFINKPKNNNGKKYISVQLEGKEIMKLDFLEENTKEEKRIDSKYGYNIIEVFGDKVRVLEADCKDKVDVKQGYIKNTGETLVCLPHRLVIEIKEEGEGGNYIDHINY